MHLPEPSHAAPRVSRAPEEASLPWRIAGPYVGVGVLWILLSDRVLGALLRDPDAYARAQTLKGWLFVAATGTLLFFLARGGAARLGRSERAARAAEERYRLLVRTAPDMILVLDREGRFVDLNPAALRESGYGAEDLVGRPFHSLIAPEDLDVALEQSRLALSGTPTQYEVRYLRKDGETRWISCTNTPIHDEGRVDGVLAIMRDVTEERRAEEALRRSEESFRSLVENAQYGIFRTGPGGTVLLANPALARILGFADPAELVSRDVTAFYADPEERSRLVERMRHEDEVSVEVTWKRNDGTPLRVLLSGRVVRDRSGAAEYFEGLVQDVTERKRDEARQRQTETLAAIGTLVSGVAHELNNPLSAILHFAEDLLEDPRPPADAEALGTIRDQARRSRAIVRDLLSFTRAQDEHREVVSMRGLVERATRAMVPGVERCGARLELSVGEGEQCVCVSPPGIEQVVTNLVTNAAQAAGAGGTVRLAVRCDARECTLVVEDDGPGIRAEVLPRVFEPFFTTKPAGQGTGLGLPVSRGIVEQHGGCVTAENRSAAEGGGARFTVRLPRALPAGEGGEAPPPPVDPPEPPAPPPDAGLLPARVLVIDDETAIRTALRRFFSRRGWEVEEAADGGEGLRLLLDPERSAAYAAVVCDLKMPGISGAELYERLREARPELLRRLIFSTGDVASPEASALLARARVPVVEKPFELAALAEVVERVRAEG